MGLRRLHACVPENNLRDEPVITHAVFPEPSKPRTVQRLSDTAWIIQLGSPLVKELQDALAGLRASASAFSAPKKSPLRDSSLLNRVSEAVLVPGDFSFFDRRAGIAATPEVRKWRERRCNIVREAQGRCS